MADIKSGHNALAACYDPTGTPVSGSPSKQAFGLQGIRHMFDYIVYRCQRALHV